MKGNLNLMPNIWAYTILKQAYNNLHLLNLLKNNILCIMIARDLLLDFLIFLEERRNGRVLFIQFDTLVQAGWTVFLDRERK